MTIEAKAQQRFWSKVDRDGPTPAHRPELGPCWVWTACADRDGYGFFVVGGRQHRAHRVAWVIQRGDMPDGLCVLHCCDNPPCVRGSHLFLGTRLRNAADKFMKGRQASKVTEADVIAIRSQYADGALQQSLAEKFGIRQPGISRIVNRKSWTYVE